jgi:hypothetical protein
MNDKTMPGILQASQFDEAPNKFVRSLYEDVRYKTYEPMNYEPSHGPWQNVRAFGIGLLDNAIPFEPISNKSYMNKYTYDAATAGRLSGLIGSLYMGAMDDIFKRAAPTTVKQLAKAAYTPSKSNSLLRKIFRSAQELAGNRPIGSAKRTAAEYKRLSSLNKTKPKVVLDAIKEQSLMASKSLPAKQQAEFARKLKYSTNLDAIAKRAEEVGLTVDNIKIPRQVTAKDYIKLAGLAVDTGFNTVATGSRIYSSARDIVNRDAMLKKLENEMKKDQLREQYKSQKKFMDSGFGMQPLRALPGTQIQQ